MPKKITKQDPIMLQVRLDRATHAELLYCAKKMRVLRQDGWSPNLAGTIRKLIAEKARNLRKAEK